MIILDTNVISELMREAPDANVKDWLAKQGQSQFALTTITLAEIGRGLARLPVGKRRSGLEKNFEAFTQTAFENRLLAFDYAAAVLYGNLAFARERSGLKIDAVDLMIAAIAKARGASIATRNTRDFTETGIELFDPWKT